MFSFHFKELYMGIINVRPFGTCLIKNAQRLIFNRNVKISFMFYLFGVLHCFLTLCRSYHER